MNMYYLCIYKFELKCAKHNIMSPYYSLILIEHTDHFLRVTTTNTVNLSDITGLKLKLAAWKFCIVIPQVTCIVLTLRTWMPVAQSRSVWKRHLT